MTEAHVQFLDGLAAQRANVAHRAATQIVAEIPSYQALDARAISQLTAVISELYGMLIARWRLGDGPGPHADADVLTSQVLHAVKALPIGEATPLSDRMTSIRVATETVLHTVQEVAASMPGLDAGFVLWAVSIGYDLVNSQTSALAASAQKHPVDAEQKHRRRLERTLIGALIDSPADLDLACATVQELGIPLTQQWQAVVTLHPPSKEEAEALRSALLGWAQQTDREVITAVAARGSYILVTGQPIQRDELEGVVTAATGVGRSNRTLDELPGSLSRARDAALVAEQQATLVLTVAGTRLERFLAGRVCPDELIGDLLGPMLALPAKQGELVAQSLQAYLDESCSVTAAAQRLHLHPQSFRYRLGKLDALFGDDLRDPSGRMLLQIAITRYHDDDDTRAGPWSPIMPAAAR
jgi:hypothetical protein